MLTIKAAQAGDLKAIKTDFARTKDTNASDDAALCLAAKGGHAECVEYVERALAEVDWDKLERNHKKLMKKRTAEYKRRVKATFARGEDPVWMNAEQKVGYLAGLRTAYLDCAVAIKKIVDNAEDGLGDLILPLSCFVEIAKKRVEDINKSAPAARRKPARRG